jgi:cation/acetate symporter
LPRNQPDVTPEQRVILSKFALLGIAMLAAFVAALKPADILPLVPHRSHWPHPPLCR